MTSTSLRGATRSTWAAETNLTKYTTATMLTSPEILERVDQAGGEAGHLRPANIHRRRRSQNGMGRVCREGNENEKEDGGVHRMKLSGGQDDNRFEEIESRGHRCAAALENLI